MEKRLTLGYGGGIVHKLAHEGGPRTLKIKDQTVQTTLKSLLKQRARGHLSNVFVSFQKNFKKEPNQVITGKITEKDQRYFDRNEQTLN